MDKDTEKYFASKAKNGAHKICGIGNCRNAYNCGHTNKKVLDLPEIGKRDKECPLAKFHVDPDPRKLYEIPYGDSVPSDEEFFALCAYSARTRRLPKTMKVTGSKTMTLITA